VFHPILTPDDSHIARLTRTAFSWLLEHWRQFDAIGAAPEWQRCGVLQLARDARERAAQRAAIAALGCPPAYAQYVDAGKASACAGVQLAAGGLWFAEGGWIRPASLASALIARSRANLIYGREAAALEQEGTRWLVRDREGEAIAEAGAVVLANAGDALRLAPTEHIRLRRVRGQLTHLPPLRQLKTVLLRGGMVLPAIDGISVTGASFDLDDEDRAVRADSHAGNLERLEGWYLAPRTGSTRKSSTAASPSARWHATGCPSSARWTRRGSMAPSPTARGDCCGRGSARNCSRA
jgi:tRNA 5-methylaminomethyl-2-thiouridine biosynthesis bifunctional protein